MIQFTDYVIDVYCNSQINMKILLLSHVNFSVCRHTALEEKVEGHLTSYYERVALEVLRPGTVDNAKPQGYIKSLTRR